MIKNLDIHTYTKKGKENYRERPGLVVPTYDLSTRGLRQKDCFKFKSSLGYRVSFCL